MVHCRKHARGRRDWLYALGVEDCTPKCRSPHSFLFRSQVFRVSSHSYSFTHGADFSLSWNVAAPMPQGLINGLEQRQLPITSKLRLSGDLSMAIRPTFRLAISELRELTLTNCDNYEFLFGALNTGENQLGKLRVQTRSISPALEVFLSTTCSLTVLELQCNNIIEKEEVITECIRNNGDNLQSIKLCIDPAQLACAPSVANGQIQTRLRDHKFRGCTVAMLGQINQFCPNLKQLYVDVALDSLAEVRKRKST